MLDLSDGCLNSLVVDLKGKKNFVAHFYGWGSTGVQLRGGSLLFDPGSYWNIGYVAKKIKKKERFSNWFLFCWFSLLLHFQDKLSLINQILVLVVIEH